MAYTKFTGWESTTLPKKLRAALANMEDGVQEGLDAAQAAQATADAALPKSGGTMSGPIDMGAQQITNIGTPTSEDHAATKAYVDSGDEACAAAAAEAKSAADDAAWVANAALPRSGGTMSGPINMGGSQITNVGDPSADQHAATKKYVDATTAGVASQLEGYLPTAGGTMAGPIGMGSNKITDLLAPQSESDAANKKYVDDVVLPVSTTASAAASTASSAATTALNAETKIDEHAADQSIHVPELEPDRVVVSDDNGMVETSPVTGTELSYVSGVTSSIQDQLDSLSSDISGLEQAIADGDLVIAATQSDWSQNDESAPDYVKNRTHWTEHMFADLHDGLLSFTECTADPLSAGCTNHRSAGIRLTTHPNTGSWPQNVYITIDNVKYTCPVGGYANIDQDGILKDYAVRVGTSGNEYIGCAVTYIGYHALLIVCTPGLLDSTFLVQVDDLVYHVLDDKFLPSSIARLSDIHINSIDTGLTMSGAAADAYAVGSALEKKADKVDLIQSDWSQNDDSGLDFVKNRTHWTETSFVQIYSGTIQFSEYITDSLGVGATNYLAGPVVSIGANGTYRPKLAITIGGVRYICEVTVARPEQTEGLASCRVAVGSSDYIVCRTNYHGYWALYIHCTAGLINSQFLIESMDDVYHTLDARFLPDDVLLKSDNIQSDWAEESTTAVGYIKNRTHSEITISQYTQELANVVAQCSPYNGIAGMIYCLTIGTFTFADGIVPNSCKMQSTGTVAPVTFEFDTIYNWTYGGPSFKFILTKNILESGAVRIEAYTNLSGIEGLSFTVAGFKYFSPLRDEYIPSSIARKSYVDSFVHKQLLWENASPTSIWGASGISISTLYMYNQIEIEYRFSTSSELADLFYLTTGPVPRAPASTKWCMHAFHEGKNYYRYGYNERNQVIGFVPCSVWTGSTKTTSADVDHLIPYRVWGIK